MRLPRQLLTEIFEHSAASADEVCGILVGSRRPQLQINEIIPGRNIHASPRRHFLLDAASLLRADTLATRHGSEIVGFYHSHPNGSGIPSAQDRWDAWPDMVMLVVAGAERTPRYLCAWQIDAARRLLPLTIMLT